MRIDLHTRAYEWMVGARFALPVLIVVLAFPALAQLPILQGDGTLKVMTYNVDVGTEYANMMDPSLPVFKDAASQMVSDIRASDPAGRMQAIAREIAAANPHIVSLQEISTLSTGTTKDNLTLEFDYLQLLLDALSAQGVHYTTAGSLVTWSAIVPTTTGFAQGSWRIVLLARSDLNPADFYYSNFQAGKWTVGLTVKLPALNGRADLCPVPLRASDGACRMPWPRGWISMDVFYRDKLFRIIGGHLDSASELLEIPQAGELLAGPAKTSLPVIVAADLNCDCSTTADAMYPTCVNFAKAGFVDTWSVAHPYLPGYTKHLPTLNQRSDYVMARGKFGVHAAVIVGAQFGDKTGSGLWPSDHAGVVARLRLAAPEN